MDDLKFTIFEIGMSNQSLISIALYLTISNETHLSNQDFDPLHNVSKRTSCS